MVIDDLPQRNAMIHNLTTFFHEVYKMQLDRMPCYVPCKSDSIGNFLFLVRNRTLKVKIENVENIAQSTTRVFPHSVWLRLIFFILHSTTLK